MDVIRASVAMAVYNGEKYLKDQIDSIVRSMSPSDELVISYDKSSDSTYDIIHAYESIDHRIHCFMNCEKPGVSGNFTNAAKNCRGKYILFSDQDDIWLDNKIQIMVDALESEKADLVVHNGYVTNADLVKLPGTMFERNHSSISPIKNFIKGRFLGCCMAFKAETMNYILPFPNVTDDFPHDIFAAILVGLKGKVVMIDNCLILHRYHDGNATPKKRNPLHKLIKNRFILLSQIIRRLVRG